MRNSKIFISCGSLFAFACDVLILLTVTSIDNHFNHGNFFDGQDAWRLGVLGMPLALLGIGLAIMGMTKAKKFMKVIALLGLILCLLLTIAVSYEFVIANNPSLWGA